MNINPQDFLHFKQEEINTLFISACDSSNLEAMEFLLTNKNLKHNADIHCSDERPFRIACRKGHLDVVKFLLASPTIKEHVDIDTCQNTGATIAVSYNQLEVLNYFLTSPDLKKHLDPHFGDDLIFKMAGNTQGYDIIHYLIFDYNIEKTEEIKQYLIEDPNQQIIKWFEQRDLHQDINTELISNNNKIGKLKL
jgi:ankyrin repeat protein